METFEQENQNFNTKKLKKKGLIIGIGILAVVVALVISAVIYIGRPQFIFSKAIDKLLVLETNNAEKIKMSSSIKVSLDSEDEEMQEIFDEIKKCTLNYNMQVDAKQEKFIADIGLKYDKESVMDLQLYYGDEEAYMYFDEIFDKYIEAEMDDQSKETLKTAFETMTTDKVKNIETAMEIVKDELKEQIKEEGKFDKEKAKIKIDGKETKVSKSTLTITEEELYKISENIFSNLAKNDDFLDCFEESPKDILKQLAESIGETEAESDDNNIKISIYTKGLLNEFVGAEFIANSESGEAFIVNIVKESKEVYSFDIKAKEGKTKTEIASGKIEIKVEKDSKDEKKGQMSWTLNVDEMKLKLDVDYLVEYGKEIDKIDVSNSVDPDDITEEELNEALEKLMERPLIGEIIEEKMTIQEPEDDYSQITTSQNEVADYGYSVKYSVPTGFIYEGDYSSDYRKYYAKENEDYTGIDATISIGWYTDEEYREGIESDYDYLSTSEFYKNVTLEEVKTVTVGDKTFNYQKIKYESSDDSYFQETYEDVYIWYEIDGEYVFRIELEATDEVITEDLVKEFLNVTITENN